MSGEQKTAVKETVTSLSLINRNTEIKETKALESMRKLRSNFRFYNFRETERITLGTIPWIFICSRNFAFINTHNLVITTILWGAWYDPHSAQEERSLKKILKAISSSGIQDSNQVGLSPRLILSFTQLQIIPENRMRQRDKGGPILLHRDGSHFCLIFFNLDAMTLPAQSGIIRGGIVKLLIKMILFCLLWLPCLRHILHWPSI